MPSYLSYDKPRPASTRNSERVGKGVVYTQRATVTKPVTLHRLREVVVFKRNDAEQRYDISTRLVSDRKLAEHQRKNLKNYSHPNRGMK